MIRIQNLHLAYRKTSVIKGLNLDIHPNSIQGIVGLNGAGKTSLLNAIYGKTHFQEGIILYEDQPLNTKNIAFLETHNFFYSRITGQEYLDLFKWNNPDFDYAGWNRLFGLPLDHLIDTYSTGMKKKLAFLAVLSLDRPILILDEPFNGLDLETNEHLKDILKQLKTQNKTIILTSHILDTLVSTCDTIHYLNGGIIEASYLPNEYANLRSEVRGKGFAS